MEQYLDFMSNHPVLVTAFIIVLLMFIWSLFTSVLYGKFMLPPDQVVYHINHRKACVLDLRPSAEYDQGHIEGAVRAGMDVNADIASTVSKIGTDKERVIILCGDNTLMLRCLRVLHLGGYKNVFCLKGGIHAWRESGLPLPKNG